MSGGNRLEEVIMVGASYACGCAEGKGIFTA